MARRWLRYSGVTIATIVVLVLLIVGGVYGFTAYRFNRPHVVPLHTVAVLNDPATIEHGHHLVTAIGKCVYCHGDDLGGRVFIDDPVLGRVVASNLTSGSGGILTSYTPELLERAIRHGVQREGRSLVIMPSEDFHAFSDEDVGAIIAYLHTLPPVNRQLPPSNIKLVPRLLYTAGQFPILSAEKVNESVPSPLKTPMASPIEYGHYLADAGGCTGCHGPGLSGGKIPGVPPDWKPAANLTPSGIGTWHEADFVRALRTGVTPNGTPLDTIMPWKLAREMSDDEIHALWLFLQSVPARPYGNR